MHSVFFPFLGKYPKTTLKVLGEKQTKSPVFWFCVNTLMGLLNNWKISNQIELQHSPRKYQSDTYGMHNVTDYMCE